MKTFDEAVLAVTSKSPDLFSENLSRCFDHMDNDVLTAGIETMAQALIVRLFAGIQSGAPELLILATVCYQVHRAVSFGMLIGMEMEKQESPVDA